MNLNWTQIKFDKIRNATFPISIDFSFIKNLPGFYKFSPYLVSLGFRNPLMRKVLVKAVDDILKKKNPTYLDRVDEDKYAMLRAVFHTVERIQANKGLSKACIEKVINIFFTKAYIECPHNRQMFKEKYGFEPPTFITISPTNICNLKCKGCYAGDIYKPHTLDYDVLDRIIREMRDVFGSHFIVFSGGEPFLYKDKGMTLLDIVRKFDDIYFMAYTNGTLIDERVTRELAELGNFTPAISVEGFEKETDERRGKGTWKKIMDAMNNLQKYGVPFGISVTPTKYNADLLLSDEFTDFFFKQKGAFYGWYFQYMPIGRKPSMDLVVTPEQRVEMYRRIWKKVREEKLFIADFWNSGTASSGCMSAARGEAYFYIMWDGTITPCVFIPFADKTYGNIYEVYNRGESLTDVVVKSPFFKRIRDWQNEYYLSKTTSKDAGNILAPCIIRDHSSVFYNIVKEVEAKPVDEGSKTFLSFIEDGSLPEYNRRYRELSDPIWEKEYLNYSNKNNYTKN